MLMMPSWDKNAKALDDLITWLKKQPSDKEYNYLDPDHCLCAQYFRETLNKKVSCGSRVYVAWSRWFFGSKTHVLPPIFNAIALEQPHTMGEALTRAIRERSRC